MVYFIVVVFVKSWNLQLINLLNLLHVNDRFVARPDQWSSKQASKLSTYKEILKTFGSGEVNSSENGSFLAHTSKKMPQLEDLKKMRKEIDNIVSSPAPFFSTSGYKEKPNKVEKRRKKFSRISVDDKSSNLIQ